MSAAGVARFLFSDEPRLRRLLGYWAATGIIYLVCIALVQLQVRAGAVQAAHGNLLSWFGIAGVTLFFCVVRASSALGIKAWQLAMMQSMFAIVCGIGAYAVTGPVRGASLMVPLVVIVFCVFSLRPRQTLLLGAIAIAALGATMAAMVSRDPVAYPAHIEAMHFALAVLSIVAVTVLTAEMSKLRARLKRQKEELLAAVGTIRALATVDELTSLANRRYMNEVLDAEERRSGTAGACIALLDLDHFKQVNDRHGHAGGDLVLRAFAAAARAELRAADVLARWGGEEFLLMLPDTAQEEAMLVLERMARHVAELRLPALDPALAITFSAGLVERGVDEPFSDTISRADKAMYVAKTSGRNRIVRR